MGMASGMIASATDQHEHTLAGPAICAGVGVHTGSHVRLSIRPAASGSGVVFVRADIKDRDNRVPVSPEAVVQTRLGTVIGNAAGVTVSTIEHLMAALSALGVDNAVVELDGPEVPIMDGSALPFVSLLDRAGFRRQEATQAFIEILKPVRIEDGDKSAALLPCDRFEMFFEIEFPTAAIGRQSVDLVLTEQSFREELSAARTFGFLEEVEALRAAGLGRGASLDNVVVIDGDRVINPEGLRFADEFVRHKALDAVGDLYVLGAPLLGRFEGRKAGHALNNLLLRALMARPDAWRRVAYETEFARAG
jgi:UDP-3-O-[3-hydroxymyristoyl] N-acetylglucosamine deacetylase